jgi:hypothetical protein
VGDQSTTVELKVTDNSHELDQTWLYFESARSPLASAVFILPLMLVYEFCVFRLPADELHNGAHQWANKLLLLAGMDDLLIPLFMFLILFLWQYYSRKSVQISYHTLLGMWSESILFALILISLGQAQQLAMIGRTSPEVERINQAWQPIFLDMNNPEHTSPVGTKVVSDVPNTTISLDQEINSIISNINNDSPEIQTPKLAANLEHPRQRLISYLGAGIYEETFFRLLLIPLLYFSLKPILYFTSISMLLSLIVSSLVFALAHEVIPLANHAITDIPQLILDELSSDVYRQFVFAFRTMAGLYFGILFYLRGFGIAVGAHLVYDIFVGIMLK